MAPGNTNDYPVSTSDQQGEDMNGTIQVQSNAQTYWEFRRLFEWCEGSMMFSAENEVRMTQ